MSLKHEDVNRLRARLRAGRITRHEERFLHDCWDRHHSHEARDILLEKLIPVFRDAIHAEMRARGIPASAADGLLGEAICGPALPKDGERLVARGILGAIQTYDDAGARIGTYVRKWVRGAVADWKRARDRATAGHVSHMDDGTPYLDVLSSPPAEEDYAALLGDGFSRMSARDRAVLQAVVVDEKTKVETCIRLGISRPTLDDHVNTAVARLRAEVAESDDTPLAQSLV